MQYASNWKHHGPDLLLAYTAHRRLTSILTDSQQSLPGMPSVSLRPRPECRRPHAY